MRNICYSSTLSFVCQALFRKLFRFLRKRLPFEPEVSESALLSYHTHRSLSSTFFRSSMAFVNQYGSNPLGVSESQPCYLSTSRTACQELFSETFQVRHLSGSSCRSLAPTALTEYQIPAHLSTPFSKFFFLLTFFAVPDRFPGIPLAIIHNNKGKRQHFHAAVTTTVMSSLSF